jgi:hypothetical protein
MIEKLDWLPGCTGFAVRLEMTLILQTAPRADDPMDYKYKRNYGGQTLACRDHRTIQQKRMAQGWPTYGTISGN